MKQFFKISLVVMTVVLAFAACNKLKVDPLPHYDNGNAVTLTSSASAISPTLADSNNVVVTFNWTNPNYATDTSNYKYVLEIDSAGRNFSQSATKIVMVNYSTGITGREMNNILLNYGFTIGQPYNLEARVASSYGNNNEKYYSNTVGLSVSAFEDPSSLTVTSGSVALSLPNAALPADTFYWTRSFTGYTGHVTYTIQYALAGTNFASTNDLLVGVDSVTKWLTQDQMNQSAINSGIAMGAQGTVEYRIKAVTAAGAIAYSNAVSVLIQGYISILRFYMPGNYQAATGQGNDWDPPTAPELIRDQRPGLLNNMYYTYMYLPANSAFKFTQGQSWSIAYGDAGGGTISTSGGDVHVNTAGFYRITINVGTGEYNIMEGRMGFVGGSTGADWQPPNVFPNYALGNSGTNLFVGLTDLATTGGGWKLIDNNVWNSGNNAVDETRSYGTPLPSGSTLETNGGNFNPPGTAGRYRAIWDGRDRDNVKYEMYPADEMRIVGNGLTGVPDWDPGNSPTMTYSGNGVWTITLPMDAGESFKFVAGNAWGAFDYEDQSGGSQTLGTPRPISWNSGGGDFKTPVTAGTYTVTLNENTQTVTVN